MLEIQTYRHVFTPLKLRGVTLKNRLGFAPMVCNQCTIDGTVTDAMVEFISMQARCGAAYVTIGDTQVDDELGGAFMATMNIARHSSIPGMIRLQEAARYNGAVLSVELNHSGRGAKDHLISGPAIAPSAVCLPRCSQNVRPMDREDLDRVKDKFVRAARHAVQAGFPMVMIHAAHNNLLGQFLSPLSNLRTDEYGGSPENRRRYPLEVIRAVREAVGEQVAIELRVSGTEMTPGGLELEESLQFMEAAQEYVDLIHVSRGIVYNDACIYTLPTFLREPLLNLELARQAKARLRVPVATVGNFRTLDDAEAVLASGAADVIFMARAWLADHQMMEKCLENRHADIRPCLRCHRGCIDNSSRGKAIHCSVNPELGFEQDIRALQLFILLISQVAADVAHVNELQPVGFQNGDPVRAAERALLVIMEGVDEFKFKRTHATRTLFDFSLRTVIAVSVGTEDTVRFLLKRTVSRDRSRGIGIRDHAVTIFFDLETGVSKPCDLHSVFLRKFKMESDVINSIPQTRLQHEKTDPVSLQDPLSESDRRDSNPRSRPWQGRALPTTPLSHVFIP